MSKGLELRLSFCLEELIEAIKDQGVARDQTREKGRAWEKGRALLPAAEVKSSVCHSHQPVISKGSGGLFAL